MYILCLGSFNEWTLGYFYTLQHEKIDLLQGKKGSIYDDQLLNYYTNIKQDCLVIKKSITPRK